MAWFSSPSVFGGRKVRVGCLEDGWLVVGGVMMASQEKKKRRNWR